MTFDMPSKAEVNRPAAEVSLMVVRRLFVDRLERELEKLTTRRTVRATGPVSAPDRREVVSTGSPRTFAKLAETWLEHRDVVAVEQAPSPAENGVRAVLEVGLDSKDAAWAAVASGRGARLDGGGTEPDRDPTLARGHLLAVVLGEDDAFEEAVARWWQDNLGDAELPLDDESERWLTEQGHGPERWVQELARAVVDAYFLRQYAEAPHDPVETLTDLPFPLEAHGHRFAVEDAYRSWLTSLEDRANPARYPEAGDLVEECRKRKDYLMG